MKNLSLSLLIFFLVSWLPDSLRAADTKISDMPAASSVAGADVVPIVQSGVNKKASFTVQKSLWDTYYLPSDTGYGSSWNGVTTIAPSKNAVYDWGHLFDTDDDGKVNVLDQGVGIPITNSSGVLQTPLAIGTDIEAWDADLDALAALTVAQGRIIYYGASGWVTLSVGADGKVLTTHGTGADPTWEYPADNTAYDATTWDGVTTIAPSKNAVRDKFESLAAVIPTISDTAFAASWDAVTTIAPSKNAVYDWGHTFDTDDDGKVNVLDLSAGIPKTDSSGVLSLATLGTDYLDSTYIDDTAYNATTWNGDTTHAPSKNAVRDKIESLTVTLVRGFSFGLKRASGVPTGKLPMYWTCPYSGNITAWNITVDTGTITVKVWKTASSTAHPTASDSINTSGIALSSNTHIHSTTLSDFTTTAVTAGDTFAVEVTAVSGVLDLGGSIEITQ